MAPVRYGPARVTFSGDEVAAKAFLGEALHLLRNTEERARLSGLTSLGAQWRLTDDAYCYAVVAGTISAVHIVAGHLSQDETKIAIPVAVPDFVSGVVRGGTIETVPAKDKEPAYKVLSTFHPTQPCATAYPIPVGYQKIARLQVEPYSAFSDLKNPSESGKPVYSQYVRLKPTMYSGAMRQVVQALMGFGRQRRNGSHETSLYETFTSPTTGVGVSAQYAKDVSTDGLQIRYDWRFSRTHGITRASDGRLWLVEIGISSGVIAMPLSLHPATTTAAFRDYVTKRLLPRDRLHEHNNDGEALAMLDALGGFPTGESFPPAAQTEAWVRAGRVLRLMAHDDVAVFYAYSPYSSAMGWAFSGSGKEAHNTAWRVDENGIQQGVHYAVMLSIGASARAATSSVADLKAVFETARKDWPDVIDAAIWKLDYLDASQRRIARSRLSSAVNSAVAYVDGLVLPALAQGAARMQRQSEGPLYNFAKTGGVIRFPEPLLNLLVSHRMKPAWGGSIGGGPRCDTTMHVFFRGEELKYVRYFQDPRTTPGVYTDDYEACMFIGSWSAHYEGGAVGHRPGFYSNDFDDRVELPVSTSDTTITGVDLGYCRITVNDDILYPPTGNASRTKRFRMKEDTRAVSSPAVSTSVSVPFGEREAYYYSVAASNQGTARTISYSFKELGDPWSCNYWRNFPGYTGHFIGDDITTGHWGTLAQHPDGCGPVTDRTAASPSPNYTASACGDIADSGPWCGVCDNIDRMTFSLPAPPVPAIAYENTAPSGEYRVWLVSSNERTPVLALTSDKTWHWALHSPFNGKADETEDQYIEATGNTLGGGDSMRYSVDINSAVIVRGAPIWPGMESGALTYIGVIE